MRAKIEQVARAADAALVGDERNDWFRDSLRYASELSYRGASLERVQEAFTWAAKWRDASAAWHARAEKMRE